jgi:hypothetical protein
VCVLWGQLLGFTVPRLHLSNGKHSIVFSWLLSLQWASAGTTQQTCLTAEPIFLPGGQAASSIWFLWLRG